MTAPNDDGSNPLGAIASVSVGLAIIYFIINRRKSRRSHNDLNRHSPPINKVKKGSAISVGGKLNVRLSGICRSLKNFSAEIAKDIPGIIHRRQDLENRVFETEIHGWAEIYKYQDGLAVYASHMFPSYTDKPKRNAMLTAIVLAFPCILIGGIISKLFSLHNPDAAPFVIGLTMAMLLGWASHKPWKLYFSKVVILYLSPDGQMRWQSWSKTRFQCNLNNPFELKISLPHRSAAAEVRSNQEFVRRNPQKEMPEPVFQIASELILYTGPFMRDWYGIASIADDEHGEKARDLMTAIQFAHQQMIDRAAFARRFGIHAGAPDHTRPARDTADDEWG